MKRAVFLLLLAACTNRDLGDYPSRPGGGGPVTQAPGGATDGGVTDGGDGDAGVLITGRVCIVTDLRTPTVCDGRSIADASKVTVVLGTRSPTAAPTKSGDFTIFAQLGTDLVWRVSGNGFITSVMPFGTDNIIPIVRDGDYLALASGNGTTLPQEGLGSVVARVVNGLAPASGVVATTTLTSSGVAVGALYDTSNADIWGQNASTQTNGIVWFPGVDVTTTGTITLAPPAPAKSVPIQVSVEENSITFVTQDIR